LHSRETDEKEVEMAQFDNFYLVYLFNCFLLIHFC
jgi:hypothetical protein